MPSLQQVMSEGAAQLRSAQIESAAIDARALMKLALGSTDDAQLVRSAAEPLAEEVSTRFAQLVTLRERRMPLSHITGWRDFWKDRFVVSPAVLDPRPDSETLIEAALEAAPLRKDVKHILDLGTGSGCLLLSLLREFEDARGLGIDLSADALQVARINAGRLGLAHRTSWVKNDWAVALGGEYDIVISNPPYIASDDLQQCSPEVAQYEPRLALVGGQDGLDAYRVLAPQCARLLAPKGFGIWEIGAGQAKEVSGLLQEAGLVVRTIRADLAGVPRAVVFSRDGTMS